MIRTDGTPTICTPRKTSDFHVRDEGTIWLFTPLTAAANEFISEHVEEDALFYAGSLVVEHRYVVDLVDGILDEGLTLK